MKTITLSATFDGECIRLEEDFPLPKDARLLVTVLPTGAAADVAPRHIKRNGKNTLTNQIQTELACRDFPDTKVEILSRDETTASGMHRFVRLRRDATKAPPQDHFAAARLTFPEPVSGPIGLGYAAHFGLGLFTPVH